MLDKNGAKCKDLRKKLKKINNDFDITFNYDNESYIVTHKNKYFMKVPYGEFTRDTFEHIRKQVWLNVNGWVLDEIDENNRKIKKSRENKRKDMCRAMAEDIRKPLINSIYY